MELVEIGRSALATPFPTGSAKSGKAALSDCAPAHRFRLATPAGVMFGRACATIDPLKDDG